MSLKHVHAFFVAAAVVLALMCAGAAISRLASAPSGWAAIAAAGSAAGGAYLVRYEARFLRRWRTGELE